MDRTTVILLFALILFTFVGCEQTPSSEAYYRVMEMLKKGGYEQTLQDVNQHLEKQPKSRSLLEQKLILLLADSNPRTREEVLKTQNQLDAIGAGRFLLREQTKSRLNLVRQQSAYVLGALRDQGSLGVLKTLAEDIDPEVRTEAIHALGKLNLPESKNLLIIRLHDSSWKVRAEAADALTKLHDPTITKQLFRVVDDFDDYARMQILDAVLTLANPSQLDVYLKEIESDTLPKKTAAALALGKLKRPEAVPVFLDLLKDKDSLERLRMAQCLVQIASAAVPEITNLVTKERNPQVKEVLANYLRQQETKK